MRSQILAAVALLTVALAGCSDEPPSGEVSGSAAAVPAEGTLSLTTQDFQPGVPDPSDGQNPAYDPCPFGDQVPDDPVDPVDGYRCEFGATSINIHLMSLPDPQTQAYSAFFVDSSGANPAEEIGDLSVNGTPPNQMYELAWDNVDECDNGPPSDPDNDPCNRTNLFDMVEIRLGDVPVAQAPLQDGASFGAHPAVQGVSFTLQYAGKSVTLELSGANSTLSYEAVFYTAQADGSVAAQENHGVTGGSNDFQTQANVGTFAEVHIHVAGTKVNVARGEV